MMIISIEARSTVVLSSTTYGWTISLKNVHVQTKIRSNWTNFAMLGQLTRQTLFSVLQMTTILLYC